MRCSNPNGTLRTIVTAMYQHQSSEFSPYFPRIKSRHSKGIIVFISDMKVIDIMSQMIDVDMIGILAGNTNSTETVNPPHLFPSL